MKYLHIIFSDDYNSVGVKHLFFCYLRKYFNIYRCFFQTFSHVVRKKNYGKFTHNMYILSFKIRSAVDTGPNLLSNIVKYYLRCRCDILIMKEFTLNRFYCGNFMKTYVRGG